MAIQYDKKNKTWSVVVKYTDIATGKTKWKKKRGFALKREAAKAEQDLIENISARDSNQTGTDTFEEMLEMYIAFSQCSQEASEKKRSNMRNHFPYYDKQINKITMPMINAWYAKWVNTDYSASVKNAVIQTVKGTFKYAHDVYKYNNPAVMIRSYKKKLDEHKEMNVWTPEEFEEFIKHVDNLTYRLFFETLFWTGMRRGEAIALQKTDLSSDGVISVTKSMKHYKNGFKPPKTAQSIRDIQLDDETFNDIKVLLDSDGSFLFGGQMPLSISGIQRKFTATIEKSGVKKIRLHDLRHSHATFLINNGVNVVAVSRRLGHSTINETLKTYAHLYKKTDENLVNLICKTKKKLTKS